MQASWSDLIVAYLVVSVLVVGLPVVFFFVTFLPGLMRTTGELIGERQTRPPTSKQPARPRPARPAPAAPMKRAGTSWPSKNFANTP
jgi:Na+-transporting methylmalonyl-CoA/oxaloacetate decarboxylase gamma subunit